MSKEKEKKVRERERSDKEDEGERYGEVQGVDERVGAEEAALVQVALRSAHKAAAMSASERKTALI